jgi:hypothetical protein
MLVNFIAVCSILLTFQPMATWYILLSFWYIFPVLVCCAEKNLATLLSDRRLFDSSLTLESQLMIGQIINSLIFLR